MAYEAVSALLCEGWSISGARDALLRFSSQSEALKRQLCYSLAHLPQSYIAAIFEEAREISEYEILGT